jgi:hypothetical protein
MSHCPTGNTDRYMSSAHHVRAERLSVNAPRDIMFTTETNLHILFVFDVLHVQRLRNPVSENFINILIMNTYILIKVSKPITNAANQRLKNLVSENLIDISLW